MTEILTMTSRQPIAFYGMLIDQHHNPVVGAQVRGSVEISTILKQQQWEEHFTTTDSAGRFQFAGLHGQELVVSPTKEGYKYNGDSRSFAYSVLTPEMERHRPNQDAPVVFKMWKQQGAEFVIKGDRLLGIRADGTPFTVDLVKGKHRSGRTGDGDLIVSIDRPSQITGGQKFDWSFTIESVGGGLAEVIDPQYLNEAPAEGYKPQISQSLKATDRDWSPMVSKTFFVKSRGGNQFSSVSAEIYANYQGAAALSVDYVVNPQPGSRNLEYDPRKQATQH